MIDRLPLVICSSVLTFAVAVAVADEHHAAPASQPAITIIRTTGDNTPASQPAPASPATQPDRPGDFVGDYRSDVYRFSIKQPYFPPLDAKQQNPPVIVFSAPPEFNFSAYINVLVDPVKTNRHDYLFDTLKTLKRIGGQLNGLDRLTVDGRDACLIDWECKVDANDLHYLSYFVIDGDRVVVLTCTSLSLNFAKYEPHFRDAIRSFKITPPSKP